MDPKKVYRHPILNTVDYQFVVVEHMSDWANGSIKSDTYYQKVSHKGRPFKYIVIETTGAIEAFGRFDGDVVGATIALQGGLDHWGHQNPKFALRWALAEAIKKEQVGSFEVLKKIWEDRYGDCPFEMDENSSSDWKSTYQMDLPGDKAKPDEWEKIKDLMDTETDEDEDEDDEESSGAKGVANNGMGQTHVTEAAPTAPPGQSKRKDKAPEKNAREKRQKPDASKGSLQTQLKNKGFQAIPGYGSLWSKSGQLPAQKKIENDKIVNATPQDNLAAQKGTKDQPAAKTQGQQAPGAQQPTKVKVVDVGSEEHHAALRQSDSSEKKTDKAEKPKKKDTKKKETKDRGKNEPGDIELSNTQIKNIDQLVSQIKKFKSKDKDGLKEVIRILKNLKKTGNLQPSEVDYIGKYIRPRENGRASLITNGEPTGNSMEDFTIKNSTPVSGQGLALMLKAVGVPDAVTTYVGNSKMKPDLIFSDGEKTNQSTIKMESDGGAITVNGQKLDSKKMPDKKKMAEFLSFYKKSGQSDKEARESTANIVRALAKYNKGIKFFQKAIKKSGGKLDTIDVLPGVHPTSPENRRKLADAAVDQSIKRFEELTKGQNKEQVIGLLKSLKTANADNIDQIISDLHPLFNDPILRDAGADFVETISYIKALAKGHAAYMPAAGNWPLGDIIILPGEDTKLNTISEIAESIDMVSVSLENQSVKKGQGAPSSASAKISQTAYKNPDVKKDLKTMDGKIWSNIWDNNDLDAAEKDLREFAEKYGTTYEKILKTGKTTIRKVKSKLHKAIKDIDKEHHLKQLELEYVNGTLLQNVYNEGMDTQFFSNEKYTITPKSVDINRSNGVTSLAEMQYIFNNKWKPNGRPDRKNPGRMVNKDRRK